MHGQQNIKINMENVENNISVLSKLAFKVYFENQNSSVLSVGSV